MKHRATIFALLSVSLALGCPSSEEGDGTQPPPTGYVCNVCAKSAEAQAADDGKATGIFKGIVAGTDLTGHIDVDVHPDWTGAEANVTLNGTNHYLTVATGSGPALNVKFYSQPVSLLLAVGADGTVQSASLELVQGTGTVLLAKENSSAQVEGFEGTWTRTDASGQKTQGQFNYIVQGGQLKGLRGGTAVTPVQGTATGTVVTLTSPAGQGVRTSDEASGTFTETDGSTTTWTVRRTL